MSGTTTTDDTGEGLRDVSRSPATAPTPTRPVGASSIQEAAGYLRTRAPLLDELSVLLFSCEHLLLFLGVLPFVERLDGVERSGQILLSLPAAPHASYRRRRWKTYHVSSFAVKPSQRTKYFLPSVPEARATRNATFHESPS